MAERVRGLGAWAAVLSASALCLPASAWGESAVLHHRGLALEAGQVVRYAVDQEHGGLGRYEARIQIEAVERGVDASPESARFRWELEGVSDGSGRRQEGSVEVEGLASGRSLNAWWVAGRASKTQDTQLWLSAAACEELLRTGETRYALDVQVRRDRGLRLTRVGEVSYRVRVNGAEASLRAVEVRSELGDRLVVLRSCEQALILALELPEIVSMRVESLETPR